MRGVLVVALAMLVLGTSDASAQTDRAAAQALFDQAVALRDGGSIKAACAKFEESLRLDPAVGTRFNLADCLERDGRHASAWSHFLEVVSSTEMAGQADRADVARDRAERLAPKLSRLSIVPAVPAPGLTIRRNGVDVGAAQWSTAVPVDPGRYRIEAIAPGKIGWSHEVVVEGVGRTLTVEVPPLADAPVTQPVPAPQPMTPPPRDSGGGWSGGEIAGLAIAGVGVVGVGIGAAFGLIAMSKKSEVDDLCPDETRCTVEGIAINDEAKTAGTVSTIAFIAGGALVVGGLVLFFATPSGDDVARIDIAPMWVGDGAGAVVRARF